ncbi:Hypothetical predicted protein [Octopus vulgaris]|uniref:Uncharacterized protein n=1 Tax=Octopus vulgaris TaxID=6645 RepID=A0AA36AZ88_OCTVU|nr:Hypothetical predicted protein [Octopus vulgaris]
MRTLINKTNNQRLVVSCELIIQSQIQDRLPGFALEVEILEIPLYEFHYISWIFNSFTSLLLLWNINILRIQKLADKHFCKRGKFLYNPDDITEVAFEDRNNIDSGKGVTLFIPLLI